MSRSCLPYTLVDFLAVITCLVGGSFPTSASQLRGHVRILVLVPQGSVFTITPVCHLTLGVFALPMGSEPLVYVVLPYDNYWLYFSF